MPGHRRGGPRGRAGYGRGGPGYGFAPRGRRARRGAVRAAILVLLGEEARNGYALIQEIETRSDGTWRPSPGSIYPTLAMMEDEGLIKTVASEDDQRAYELTDKGRTALEERGEQPAPWEAAGEEVGNDVLSLVHTMRGVGMAVHQITEAGDAEQVKQAKEILAEARRSLYGILAEDPQSDEDAS